MNLWDWEAIDWDDPDDDDGNLAHCARHGVTPEVVNEVLSEQPIEVDLVVRTAEFAIVGPDRGGTKWTLLFDTSHKRGDWLRPVTGWKAEPGEIREWEVETKR